MSAYITAQFTPIDKEKLQQYGAAVPATLVKYAGEYLAKGVAEKLAGDNDYLMQVILAFPGKDQAKAWYDSPEYQALVPLRDAAMRSQFLLIGA